MVHVSKVVKGLAAYVDTEIVSKMRGSLKAWGFGAVSALVLSKASTMITALSENPIMKAFGIIDGEQIDIDSLYQTIRAQAEKSEAVVDLSIFGTLKLNVSDVDRIYRLIQEA